MTKKKKQDADLIPLAELSRRAGVSRAAVTYWLKEWEKEGVILAVNIGRRGKVVDANNPLVTRYIKNSDGKAARAAPGKTAELAENTVRKLKYRAEKLRLENIVLAKKYFPVDGVIKVLDEYLKGTAELAEKHPEAVMRRIEKEMGYKIEASKRDKAKKIMQDELSGAHEAVKKIITDFKKAAGRGG